MSTCNHPRAVTNTYVGSTQTYKYCPDCTKTYGGQENAAKRSLIAAAAEADELGINDDTIEEERWLKSTRNTRS